MELAFVMGITWENVNKWSGNDRFLENLESNYENIYALFFENFKP
jgi:hypothetical protein